MKQVKQKTVNGTTLVLYRKKSPVKGERYVYEIKDGKGQVIEENAGTTKQAAMEDFKYTVDLYREDENGSSSNGFLGDPLI
jgi:hypothetical protein